MRRLHTLHIIKTVIYAVLIVLSSIFTLHAADLPEIELPEYIISGIEKATRVRGDRLPTSITSAIVSPDAISPSRPELTALSIRSLPSKPSTDRRLKPGYWNAGISGGGFRMFGVNGCLVYAMPKVTRMGTVRLIHSPHRINIGETYGWRVRYGETHTFKGDVSICPRVTYDFNEFNLLDSLDNHRARRGDLKVDLFLSPWSTPVGAFTGYANWDGWRYSSLSDLSGFTSVFNLKHNLSLATGKLESDVFFGLENVKEDDDNFD